MTTGGVSSTWHISPPLIERLSKIGLLADLGTLRDKQIYSRLPTTSWLGSTIRYLLKCVFKFQKPIFYRWVFLLLTNHSRLSSIIIVGQKIITALSFIIGFALIFSAQLSYASHNSYNKPPKPSPTTSPVTGPVTGPVTSPVSLFTISGNITNHITKLFKRSYNRYVPESGATVKAKDIFNGHSASATTDSNGNYVINLGQKGFYKVSVSDGDAKFYTPPLHFIHLTNHKPTKTNVNFKGHIYNF